MSHTRLTVVNYENVVALKIEFSKLSQFTEQKTSSASKFV